MAIRSRGGVVALIVALPLLTGCSGDDEPEAARSGSPTTPDEMESPLATGAPAQSEAPVQTETADTLEDGRHPAYIDAVDVDARTVTVDVIQFLTGDDAVVAYAEDHPDQTAGPRSEYYIRNVNSRLRTLPAASDVAVSVLWLDSRADLESTTFDELPAYFATSPASDSSHESLLPFWLTVRDGQVTDIEEQYLP